MTALGFIETKGLLAAVEAADAMVKAADVRLIEKNLVGGGLVAITIAGEVSAVRASVDAGVAAVSCIKGATLVSEHVIARPYEEVANIIATEILAAPPVVPDAKKAIEPPAESAAPPAQSTETTMAEPVDVATPAAVEQTVTTTESESSGVEEEHYPISGLKRMTVSKLRQIARGLSGINLTEQEIRTATKKKLIEAIVNVTDR